MDETSGLEFLVFIVGYDLTILFELGLERDAERNRKEEGWQSQPSRDVRLTLFEGEWNHLHTNSRTPGEVPALL